MVLDSLINLLYPPLCSCCNNSLEDENPLLCRICLNSMDLLSQEERCFYCFIPLEEKNRQLCPSCYMVYPPFHRLASVFDYSGPAAALVKQLKYHNKPWLSKGIAAYCYYQLLKLEWTQFDVIVPMPITFVHRMERGYNQCELISKELSSLLSVPVLDIMVRSSSELCQAGKSKLQRKSLSESSFEMKKGVSIEDKTVLLIDDVITTGATIERCCEKLLTCFPKAIYVLTFCRAMD